MGELRSVVLAGGGTGGHVYPLLAFADCLRRHDPQLRITCVGTPRGLESEIIPARGYDLRHVPAHQLPRSVNLNLIRTPDRMWRAARATRAILDEVAADAVVGFGGYVSVPAYLAAWRRGTPTVIHEVNVPPGVANRMGMRFTKHVAVGFPHQLTQSPALRNARVVGVPLRQSIAGLDRAARRAEARAHFGLDPDLPTLFVFGASQGARSINLAMAGAAKAVTAAGVQVLHIMGARNEPVEIPGDLPAPYVTVKFLSEMELGYAAADLALCRGGAMTCAETAAIGMPAVYVPLPWGNGEQRRNALPVVEAGGGLLVEDGDLSPDRIDRTVVPLVRDPARLAAMSAAAASYGRRDGDEALRAYVLEVVEP
jgi:UDP-N-acetylglucosamine--N-acetylmuramyl-(pentapeptide) pyrophosphoryl-undecaprenol N-acetylglucosamine transferase